LGGNGLRRGAVIASDHLDPDAGLASLPDCSDRFLARRIADAQQPQQSQPDLDLGEIERALGLGRVPKRHRQDSLAGCRQILDALVPIILLQGAQSSRILLIGTHRQHPFRRSLDVNDAVTVVIMVQSGHKTMFGFEGNAVHAVKPFLFGDWIEAGLAGQGQQGAFGGIAFHPPFTAFVAQHGIVAQTRGAGDGL